MKKCPKCYKLYENDYAFCNLCGVRLENQTIIKKNGNKNLIIGVVVVALVAIMGIGITLSEQKKMRDTKEAMEEYRYNKAVAEYKSTPTTSDLRVNDDIEMEIDGSLVYVRGSVTNVSSNKTIRYFEVEADFYDGYGRIVDSDWTNESSEIGPYETKKFEILHKYDSSFEDVEVSVREVK